jgi:hypothetical protein
MSEVKHLGRFKDTKEVVAVVYRVLPSDPEHALVVPTSGLESDEHTRLMDLIQSAASQTAYELAEAMARTPLGDGSIMLARFHVKGLMKKVKANEIEMTPNKSTTISLDALNAAIAQQKGLKIAELALTPSNETPANTQARQIVNPVLESVRNETVLTDEQLAAKLRSDADRLYKEAARLRKQADELKNKSTE